MEATLEAQKRESRGKNEARRLRAAGRVPAVIYGSQQKKKVQETSNVHQADFFSIFLTKDGKPTFQ